MYLPGEAPEIYNGKNAYNNQQNHSNGRAVTDAQIQQGFGIDAVYKGGGSIVRAALCQDPYRVKDLKGADGTYNQRKKQLRGYHGKRDFEKHNRFVGVIQPGGLIKGNGNACRAARKISVS